MYSTGYSAIPGEGAINADCSARIKMVAYTIVKANGDRTAGPGSSSERLAMIIRFRQ